VLVLVAIASMAIGSLGAYIIGGWHLLLSLSLHLLPFDLVNGGYSPVFSLITAVRHVSIDLGDGMIFYLSPGGAAITGTTFVLAGLAATQRRPGMPSIPARVVAGLAGVVGVAGLLLALIGGAGVYTRQLIQFAGAQPLDLVLLYLGVALFGLAVYAARWSSTGALVAGGAVTAMGLVVLASGSLLLRADLPPELRRGLEITGPSGILLLIGLLLIVAGLAVRVRARRAAAPVAVV
jgi:hypothetical protein